MLCISKGKMNSVEDTVMFKNLKLDQYKWAFVDEKEMSQNKLAQI